MEPVYLRQGTDRLLEGTVGDAAKPPWTHLAPDTYGSGQSSIRLAARAGLIDLSPLCEFLAPSCSTCRSLNKMGLSYAYLLDYQI